MGKIDPSIQPEPPVGTDDKRPNIILIITDQQRYDTIAAHGHKHMHTPNLDRLANEGVSFSNCHITAASCVPSRASLFTGYYPHSTGVLENEQDWSKTWVQDLKSSGYTCVNVGKMHTNPFTAQAGFSERYNVENKDRYLQGRWYFDEWDKALAANGLIKQQREHYRKRDDYETRLGAFEWELPEELHSDMFVGNFAKWWLDTRPKTEPLFMQIGFPGPHPPYDPTSRFADMYTGRDDLPMPVVTDEDIAGQPLYMEEKRVHDSKVDHDSVLWNPDRTPEDEHLMRAYYYANVTMIDECVGEIMAALERNGYAEDTVVIFTSDHGDCLGDHGLSQKWSMYESVTRVPMIVWSPNRFKKGVTEDGLCQLFDLGPTILELAGLEPAADMEARSLVSALTGTDWVPRDTVFCEQAGDMVMTGADFITMVRNRRWKLVHLMGSTDGQLFDLESDPDELENLWNDPSHADTKIDLKNTLLEWLIQSNVQTRDRMAAYR